MEYLKLDFAEARNWVAENFPETVVKSPKEEVNRIYVLRSICNHKEAQRYLVIKKPGNLFLKDMHNDDWIAIRETLSKNYSSLAFNLTGAKICTGFHFWPNKSQLIEFSYSIAMPIQKGFYYEQNPYGLADALHVEGLTDFLTAIEMGLYEDYRIIGEHSKFRHTLLDSTSHIFILDDDTDIYEFKQHLITRIKQPIIAKFLKLPLYKDLSDYFVFGDGTRQTLNELIRNTKIYVINNECQRGVA